MLTRVQVYQPDLSLYVRLTLPDGALLVWLAVPAPPELPILAGPVPLPDSVLVVPLVPLGKPWPFLTSFHPDAPYVMSKLDVPRPVAQLYARLLPLITRLAPADLLAEAADKWYNTLT